MTTNIKNIMYANMFTPNSGGAMGLPLLLWGEPGIGKSECVKEWAQEWGIPNFVMVSPALHGEGAFGAMPMTVMGKSGKPIIAYPAPEWAEELMDDSVDAVVFVDEVTSADRGLQPPLMGLIQNRQIGFTQLGKRVRMIGACNPPEIAANGNDLAAPVANRFGHVNFDVPRRQWSQWLMGGAGDHIEEAVSAENVYHMVMRKWPAEWAKARGHLDGFISRRTKFDHQFPSLDDPKIGKAWPSRRSNVLAARALAGGRIHGLSEDDARYFVSAFVGEAMCIELFNWILEQDLPDPEELLDGKVEFEMNKRLDRVRASLSACTALVTQPNCPNKTARVQVLWEILAVVSERAADVAYETAEVLLKNGLRSREKGAVATMRRLAPMMKAAGMMEV